MGCTKTLQQLAETHGCEIELEDQAPVFVGLIHFPDGEVHRLSNWDRNELIVNMARTIKDKSHESDLPF